MNDTQFTDINTELSDELSCLCKKIKTNEFSKQMEQIKKESPYTDKINKSLLSYDEFFYYCSLNLIEAEVTRSSLIREIDLDLFVTSKGKTNRELMNAGLSPFAFDDEKGEIELHHIGQEIDSPFAELTREEHRLVGNYGLLHPSIESWRDNEFKNNVYGKERTVYWKARVQGDYTITNEAPQFPKEKSNFENIEEATYGIRDAVDYLFSQSSIDELAYLSELANNYAFTKIYGVSDFEDILKQRYLEDWLKCPHCSSINYCSNGHYNTSTENVKRYRCNECGKNFTSKQNSIISNSNLSFFNWMRLINCLYNGYSIEKTARICKISTKTVHDNRQKLFYALKLLDDEVQLAGNVVIDETYFPVSYKGNHSKNEDFVMPRPAHKRGGENHEKGLGNNVVCVACALDESGNSVARITGLGAPNFYELIKTFDNCIHKDNVSCIYSDKEKALKSFAESKEIPIKQKIAGYKLEENKYTTETYEIERNLQRINSYHSRLKTFLRKFSGISTKLMSGYLNLFAFKEREKVFGDEEFKNLLVILATPNLYKSLEELANEYKLQENNKFIPKASIENRTIKNMALAKKMGEAYAKGKTQKEIAAIYGISETSVGRTLKQLRECGYYYYKPQKQVVPKVKKLVYESPCIERNAEIAELSATWKGTRTEFLDFASKKYGLSREFITNIVSRQKRAEALKCDIHPNDEYKYKDMRVGTRHAYLSLYLKYKPDKKITYDFVPDRNEEGIPLSIRTAIDSMYSVHKYYLKKIRHLPYEDSIKRDRAICVDYLNWKGSKKGFYKMASKKYFISEVYLREIIRRSFEAKPERYINKLD